MPAAHNITPISVYQVAIDGNTWNRNTLTVSYDATAMTVTVLDTASNTLVLNAVRYSNISDGSNTTFPDYNTMHTYVQNYVLYYITTVVQHDAFGVYINGVNTGRIGIDVEFDDADSRVTVISADVTVIDDVSYDGIYPDGSLTGFATYAAMKAWFYQYVNRSDVFAVNLFKVGINYAEVSRQPLTVVLDDDGQTLTVSDGSGTYIGAQPYGTIYLQGNTTPFASYDALKTWVLTNVEYNAVELAQSDVNAFVADSETYLRFGTQIIIDTDGNLTIINAGTTIVEAQPYMYISYDGSDSGFASVAAMQQWLNQYVRFNGARLAKTTTCPTINGKPFPFNGLTFSWDDEAQTLEARYSHGDRANRPIPNLHYSMCVDTNNRSGFASYGDLINYITLNFFRE